MRGAEIEKSMAAQQTVKRKIHTAKVRFIRTAARGDSDGQVAAEKITPRKLRADGKSGTGPGVSKSDAESTQL